MSNDDGVIRSIAWQDLCAWTLLFRLFRLSVSFQLLALALIGVWLSAAGWALSNRYLGTPERLISTASVTVNATPVVPQFDTISPEALVDRLPGYLLVEPIRRLFMGVSSGRELAYLLIGSLMSLLIWGWLGGAMTRIAVVRLGRDERVGFRESLVFSGRKILSYIGAPLMPITAMLLLWVPVFILGWLMRADFGVVLAGGAWIFIGVITFSMALFALGVCFGWPLMWAAISAEGSDAFDAISRSFAYTVQRPLQYLIYTAIAAVLGGLGWFIVKLFCESMVHFAMLGIATGAGSERYFGELLPIFQPGFETDSSIVRFGAAMIGGLNQCFRSIQCAYGFAFMWTAASGIYLLVRRDADNTEIESVYLPEDAEVAYEIPLGSLTETESAPK